MIENMKQSASKSDAEKHKAKAINQELKYQMETQAMEIYFKITEEIQNQMDLMSIDGDDSLCSSSMELENILKRINIKPDR